MTSPPKPNPLNEAADDDSLEALLTSIDEKQEDPPGLQSRLPCVWRSLVVHALLLSLASTFFVLWVNTVETPCHLDSLLIYSPVNEMVQYVEKQFDGNMNTTSVFRGYPSPAIDDAWARISINVPATRLTYEQFLMVGGDDNNAAVKYRPEDGGGYMAQVDGYHTLHCLDLLRKYLRRDYYAPFDPSFNGKIRPHLGHCVEIVRQKLMCTTDLTLISYDSVAGLVDPQPNLNAIHQCMDYEGLLDWSHKHSAHVLKGHVVRFGDVTDFPEAPM